jgi:hypothetical protein
MLKYYGNSLGKALCSLRGENSFQPWLFDCKPRNLFDSKNQTSKYLEWLREQLSITNCKDWYDVSQQHIRYFKGGSLLQHGFKGFLDIINSHYAMQMDNHFLHSTKKNQKLLFRIVKSLLPQNVEIYIDYFHPDIRNPLTQTPLQLDIFIPSYSLAIEYNGIQHYYHNSLFGDFKEQQKRDEIKRQYCAQKNIHLIEIPYSWKYDRSRLLVFAFIFFLIFYSASKRQ